MGLIVHIFGIEQSARAPGLLAAFLQIQAGAARRIWLAMSSSGVATWVVPILKPVSLNLPARSQVLTAYGGAVRGVTTKYSTVAHIVTAVIPMITTMTLVSLCFSFARTIIFVL